MYFRPYLWLTVFSVPSLAVLVMLGLWQLDRLVWKTELIDSFNQRANAAAMLPPDAAAVAVQLSIDRLGLADLAPAATPLAASAVARPCAGGEPHGDLTGLLGCGASSERGVDAFGPHHPQGSATRRAHRECHQHRSHTAQPGPPSGLADLQQATHTGATRALEERRSQPSGRQLCVGQDLPTDA